MSDPYFFCYRCKQHKPHRLMSDRKSPSGNLSCIACDSKLQKGISTSKAPKRLSKASADHLAANYR